MNDAHSDADLVRQAMNGRPAAYGDLARRWAGRVTGFCHAQVRDAGEAEDLAQEALLRGLRGIRTLEQPERFGSWLCGIARRVCLDWLDRRRRTLHVASPADLELDEMEAAPADMDAAIDSADADTLMREVEALTEPYRETLMLYYYDDVTYAELGEMLGISAAAVNARLTKARTMLRARLLAARRRV